MPFDEGLAETA